MNLFGSAAVQKFGCLAKLGATYDGIVYEKKFFILDQRTYWDQFHFGNKVTLVLIGRHKRSGPGWCIFNEWSCVRNAGFIGVSDGMGNAGIRNTGYNVRVHGIAVSLCKHASTAVAHLLYIYTFIRGCRISVVNPEEGTDLHFLSGLNQSFDFVCCYEYDLSGAKFFIIFVSKVDIGMTFKGNTV